MTELIELFARQLENARDRFLLAEMAGDGVESEKAVQEIEALRRKVERMRGELDNGKDEGSS
jgi:hypothetical protein